MQRYAVYFAPAPGTALAAFGDDWLGETPPDGVDAAEWAELTEAARGYCFHATLKPPFVLAKGRTAVELDRALTGFAAGRAAFQVRLELRVLGGFLALMLAQPSPAIQALADDCVVEFDPFRAPPGEAELTRRRRAKLSPAHQANLARWGYPYVFDEFRFHMTLTRRLQPPERDRVLAILAGRAAPICAEPLRIDALATFEQLARAAPFTLRRRFPFGAR